MSKLIEYAKKHNLIRNLDYADMVDHSDWSGLVEEKKDKKNHLNKDSIVKTDVIYEIPKNCVVCKIGVVSDKQCNNATNIKKNF